MKILVVDDDETDIQYLRRLCRKHEIHCTLNVASDGDEALAMLSAIGEGQAPERPDLILTDLNMPRMSGLKLVGALRSDPCLREIPAFVVSTSDRQADVDDALESGADGYFVKPLSALDLLNVLATIRSTTAPA